MLLLSVLAGLLVLTGAAAASPPVPGETAALAAVKLAVKAHRLDRATATEARREIARAVHLARVLPRARRVPVEVALEEVGALAGSLTKPRALAVLGQLQANNDYFGEHRAPPNRTDITGSDGVVYRYFVGRCFEFHPLANFSALNAHVSAKDERATQQLADALVARGVPRRGGGLGWEYYFRFEGGRAPWASGMAQAVAAQAFARAASLLPNESAALLSEAKAAYRTIPGGLTTRVAGGPWIRLYSFRSVAVLNAQLQSVLSLESYAANTADPGATTLAGRMEHTASAILPRFDTGYWSNYSLAGTPSPLSYHKFVIQLLRKLAPQDPLFETTADRFAGYLKQPPAFELSNSPTGTLRFWLSKPASVSIVTGARASTRLSLDGGWHTLRLPEPNRPGIYGVKVAAVDLVGNSTSFAAPPLVRVTAGRRSMSGRVTYAGLGSSTTASPAFAVGAGIGAGTESAKAESLGLRLVRMTIPWPPGESAPGSGVVAALQSVPTDLGLVVELSASRLPTSDKDRAALASFAASIADETPALRDLVLAPAPTLATAAVYADALAAIRSAVQGVRADVAVGPTINGAAASPQLTTVALAKELVHDGGSADVVAFVPAAAAGSGTWAAGDVARLESALGQWLSPAPPVLLEAVPTPTTVPSAELSGYHGGAPPTNGAVPPPTQATLYADAVGSASCSSSVTGLLLDRLVDDGATAQPPTGLYYAGGDPKPSAAAVKQVIAAAAHGAVVCPGTAATVTPTALTFPQQLVGGSPASVSLGCDRDCLYLATLDRPDGRPVAATRGTLTGGSSPQTINLPMRKLAAGRYQVDVRLVSRVNPGLLTRRLSPILTVG